MRVLVVHAHPVASSYNAALHERAVAALGRAGHDVDDLDLHGEAFPPVMTAEERLAYHDPAVNASAVAHYVARLRRAEALVWIFPVWTFGVPAIMKGFLDRVFLPGVAFHLRDDGRVVPGLDNVRKLAVVTTYHLRSGGPRGRGDRPARRWSQVDDLARTPVGLEVPVPAPVGHLDAPGTQLGHTPPHGGQLPLQDGLGIMEDHAVVSDVEQDPWVLGQIVHGVRDGRRGC